MQPTNTPLKGDLGVFTHRRVAGMFSRGSVGLSVVLGEEEDGVAGYMDTISPGPSAEGRYEGRGPGDCGRETWIVYIDPTMTVRQLRKLLFSSLEGLSHLDEEDYDLYSSDGPEGKVLDLDTQFFLSDLSYNNTIHDTDTLYDLCIKRLHNTKMFKLYSVKAHDNYLGDSSSLDEEGTDQIKPQEDDILNVESQATLNELTQNSFWNYLSHFSATNSINDSIFTVHIINEENVFSLSRNEIINNKELLDYEKDADEYRLFPYEFDSKYLLLENEIIDEATIVQTGNSHVLEEIQDLNCIKQYNINSNNQENENENEVEREEEEEEEEEEENSNNNETDEQSKITYSNQNSPTIQSLPIRRRSSVSDLNLSTYGDESTDTKKFLGITTLADNLSKMKGVEKEDLIQLFIDSEPNEKYENKPIFLFTPLICKTENKLDSIIPITKNFKDAQYINTVAHIPGYIRNTLSFKKAKSSMKMFRKEMVKYPALHTLQKPVIKIPEKGDGKRCLLYLTLILPFEYEPVGFTFDENDTPNTILSRVFRNPIIQSVFKEKGLSVSPLDYALRERNTFNYYYTDEKFIEFDEIRKYFAYDRDPTLEDAVPLVLVSNTDVPVVNRNTVSKPEYVKRINKIMMDSLNVAHNEERKLNKLLEYVPGYISSKASVTPFNMHITRIPTKSLIYSPLYDVCIIYTKVHMKVNDFDIISPVHSSIDFVRNTERLRINLDKIDTHMHITFNVRTGLVPENTMIVVELYMLEATDDAIVTLSDMKDGIQGQNNSKSRMDLLNKSKLVVSTKVPLRDLRDKTMTRDGFTMYLDRHFEICNKEDFKINCLSFKPNSNSNDDNDNDNDIKFPKNIVMNNTIVYLPGKVSECDEIMYSEIWQAKKAKMIEEELCLQNSKTHIDCDYATTFTSTDELSNNSSIEKEGENNNEEEEEHVEEEEKEEEEIKTTNNSEQKLSVSDIISIEEEKMVYKMSKLYNPIIPPECTRIGANVFMNELFSFNPVAELSADEAQNVYYNKHELFGRSFGIPKMIKAVSPFSPDAIATISRILQFPIQVNPVVAVTMLRFSVGTLSRDVQRLAVKSLASLDEVHFKLILPQLVEVLKHSPLDDDMLYMKFMLMKCYEEPMKIGIPMFYVALSSAEYDDDEARRAPLMLLVEELVLLSRHTYMVNGVNQYTRLTEAHNFYTRLINSANIVRENITQLNQLSKQYVDQHKKIGPKNFLALQQVLNNFITCESTPAATERMHMTPIELSRYPFITQLPQWEEDRTPTPFPVIDLVRPNSQFVDIDISNCKYFDSAKAPLLITSKNGRAILIKSGDDMRQDELTLNILTVINEIWKNAGLSPLLKLYNVTNIGRRAGVGEIVGKSKTLAYISRNEGGGITGAFNKKSLLRFLQKHNKTPQLLEQAITNFVRSCASYSVSMYVLGIGDRHNDNIMLSEDGVLFHIDFGHFLGNYKTFLGFKREPAPFNLTPDMAFVMGGRTGAKFHEFVDLCKQMYIELRKHERSLTALFEVMCTAGIPELKRVEDAWWIRDALCPGLDEAEAAASFEEKIYISLDTKRSQINNFIHLAVH